MRERSPHSTSAGSMFAEPTPGEPSFGDQQRVRLGKRAKLNELAGGDLGGGAYPVSVPVTTTIAEVRARWAHLEATPDSRSGATVGVAGRIVFQRNTGKLCFASLQSGDGVRLQAMFSLAELGDEQLARYKELVDLGDHVFVHGEVMASRRGELSVLVRQWRVAAKAISPLPNMYAELNEETRMRQRYLDLIQRAQARATVRTRATVMSSLRRTFEQHGFIELETPMLQTMHGGASARPFVTHSNAFDTDLYLRIAPELFLKRAAVGGLERVFEINRNFRNEGADSTHSPEFAMLEAYQAYTDYLGIADLTQTLVQSAALAVNEGTGRAGTHTVRHADGTLFDLGGQWDRISLYGSLSDAVGRQITAETSVAELSELAQALGVEVRLPNHGKLVEELWEHHVKPELKRPTFVLDFPVETSPLTRQHRQLTGMVEKWDLYVRGFELATGYSELVDPVLQRERFVQQAREAARGDEEAMRVDEEFLQALEYAMPPSGGMGMGIDRLLMALTGLGIRETVLFPLVRPY